VLRVVTWVAVLTLGCGGRVEATSDAGEPADVVTTPTEIAVGDAGVICSTPSVSMGHAASFQWQRSGSHERPAAPAAGTYMKQGLYRGGTVDGRSDVHWVGPTVRGSTFAAVEQAAFGTSAGP
jgi:hypothetical protein